MTAFGANQNPALDTISRVLLETATPGMAHSDGSYSRGALDAYLRLVFAAGMSASQAAQHVNDAAAELGFGGSLTFGYSTGEVKTTDGDTFTGPYMQVRTAQGDDHVMVIGVDQGALDFIDGMAG